MPFPDIRGQDKPIDRLKAGLKSGHLAGAYLFSGPEGVGKRSTAMNFAKALNFIQLTFGHKHFSTIKQRPVKLHT